MLPRVQSRIGDHLAARAQYIWTRQFGQHDASQSITNAADAQQKIAFRSQVGIIVDRQCDGFVDRSELAREVRDRRIRSSTAGGGQMVIAVTRLWAAKNKLKAGGMTMAMCCAREFARCPRR